jgi:CelD/BcsL family acetyltransferase involved in cellulose biosynthesis
LIDWMLVHKQQWLVRSNLANDWIRSPECRDLLTAMAMRTDATGGMMVMALKLDGVPITANIVSVDGPRVAGCVTAFDFRWHRYAPGSLLSEELTRWAFARGLDFDFRNGEQSSRSPGRAAAAMSSIARSPAPRAAPSGSCAGTLAGSCDDSGGARGRNAGSSPGAAAEKTAFSGG